MRSRRGKRGGEAATLNLETVFICGETCEGTWLVVHREDDTLVLHPETVFICGEKVPKDMIGITQGG